MSETLSSKESELSALQSKVKGLQHVVQGADGKIALLQFQLQKTKNVLKDQSQNQIASTRLVRTCYASRNILCRRNFLLAMSCVYNATLLFLFRAIMSLIDDHYIFLLQFDSCCCCSCSNFYGIFLSFNSSVG